MTTISSLIIKQCPHCKKHLGVWNQSSGNTFSGRYWTDGKTLFPMLMQYQSLVKTECCNNLVRLDKLDIFDVIKLWPKEKSQAESKSNILENLVSYREPEFSDYIKLLNNNTFNPKQEKHYRILAWWAGNNSRRDLNNSNLFRSSINNEMTLAEKNNIQALYKLLNNHIQNELITKAEIKRNLCEFDASKKLLKNVTDPVLKGYSDKILELCLKNDHLVCEITI
jgi:hypothetical protein